MTAPDRHELFSAYFDGEATAEERDRIERLLESSPEVRAELNEIGLVSDLLRGLPVETAPPELAAAIRRRIEREHLLPVAADDASGSSRRRWRGWLMSGSGLIASAAALLLMVWLLGPGSKEGPSTLAVSDPRTDDARHSLELADGDVSRKEVREVAFNEPDRGEELARSRALVPRSRNFASDGAPPISAARADRSAAGKSTGEAELAESADAPQNAPSETSAADDQAVASRRKMSASGVAAGGVPVDGESAGASAAGVLTAPAGTILGGLNAEQVQIGEVLPYFEVSGDRVAVVEVTVVDVSKALGAMQVLLARNAVPELANFDGVGRDQAAGELEQLKETETKDAGEQGSPPAAKAEDEGGRGSRRAAAATQPQLLALYVETTEEQLAATLEELNRDGQFVDLKLRPPVAVEQVEIAQADELTSGAKREIDKLSRLSKAVSDGREVRLQMSEESRAFGGAEAMKKQRFARSPTPPPPAPAEASPRTFSSEPAPAAAPAASSPGDARGKSGFAGPGKASEPQVGQRGAGTVAAESFQIKLNVATETLEARMARNEPMAEAKPADEAAAAPVGPEDRHVAGQFSTTNKTDAVRVPAAPVRVIFVFQAKSGG